MNRKGGLYHAQQPDRPDQRGDPAGAVLPSPHGEGPTAPERPLHHHQRGHHRRPALYEGLYLCPGQVPGEGDDAGPALQFVADDSIAQGAHILEMLRDETVVKPPNPANEHIILDEE